MNSPYAGQYLELLTPAIVPVLEGAGHLIDTGSSSHERLSCLREGLVAAAHSIDWETSGIPTMYSNENQLGERSKTPRQQADRLMTEAMNDCEKLIEVGNRYSSESIRQQGLLPIILKNSRHSLLSVSTLEDAVKNLVVSSAMSPELTKFLLQMTLDSDPVVLKGDRNNHLRFEWHPQIQEMIKVGRGEGYGCPADKKMVDTPNGKMRLTHHLWNTVIDTAYPSPSS